MAEKLEIFCAIMQHKVDEDVLLLKSDLVLKQVPEKFHSLWSSRLPPQGLTGCQESSLSSGVAPVHLSSTFHQQAHQTKLPRVSCINEGGAVFQGILHLLHVMKMNLYPDKKRINCTNSKLDLPQCSV